MADLKLMHAWVTLMDLSQVIVGTTPQMALVKVVSDELTELMGSKGAKDLEQGFPQIVLMAGLQVRDSVRSEMGRTEDGAACIVRATYI